MIHVTWSTFPLGSKDRTLSWARDAADLLLADAMRTTNIGARQRATAIRNAIAGATTDAPQDAVDAAANTYEQVRNELGGGYAAPPIDVALPAARDDQRGAPPVGDPTSWDQIESDANARLVAGDPLRGAISRWAAWSRGISQPATVDEQTRQSTLAAWARTRVDAANVQAAATGSAIPPVAPPVPLNPTPPAPASDGGFGEALMLFGTLLLLGKAFKGRR